MPPRQPILSLSPYTTHFRSNPTSLAFSGGTIDGSGAMATDTMTWSGGTLQGTGTTTVNNGAGTYDLDAAGSGGRFLERPLVLVAGAKGELAGSTYLYFESNVAGTGSFDIQGDFEVRNDMPIYSAVDRKSVV